MQHRTPADGSGLESGHTSGHCSGGRCTVLDVFFYTRFPSLRSHGILTKWSW